LKLNLLRDIFRLLEFGKEFYFERTLIDLKEDKREKNSIFLYRVCLNRIDLLMIVEINLADEKNHSIPTQVIVIQK
jgi:hypothetical protein